MAASSYDEALAQLLAHEGGYSNHPADPGGPTNFGITIHDYRRYVKPHATAADIRAMTVREAKAIYQSKYWHVLRCDDLPAGIDLCVFDYGVNSGISRAAKVLQRVVGADVDGQVGPLTLAATRQRDARTVVAAICDERLRFLQKLNTWPTFGKGWARRVAAVRAAALALAERTADGSKPKPDGAARRPVIRPASSAPGKGAVPVNDTARKTSAGGAVAASGTAASQSSDPAVVVLALVATIALALGAWLFWRWWQRRQQDAPA